MPPSLQNTNSLDDRLASGCGEPAPEAWTSAIEGLLARVRQWSFEGVPGLWRAQVAVAGAGDIPRWLEANPLAPRCYWRDRDGTREIAGLGHAWQASAQSASAYPELLARAQEQARQAGGELLCAFSFDGAPGSGAWDGFPAGLALLPAIELRATPSGTALVANLHADSAVEHMRRKTRLLELLGTLRPAADPCMDDSALRVLSRTDEVGQASFRERIRATLEEIGSGRIYKAVLARPVRLRLDRRLPAFTTLARWARLTGDSYTFAIEHAGRIFMGCSPERLFRRQGQRVETEALAGTVRRGESETEEAALEASLLEDPKLIREHAWVTRYIRDELAPWTRELEAPEAPSILKLGRIQHRRLPLQGTLLPGAGESELLAALHPTPAVCGFPRREAQRLIQHQEGAQRGWYSGVIGALSDDGAELAVAIRSVLVHGDEVSCYSGVGIVEGSDPEAEWQELEAKIEPFLHALEA